MKVLRYIRAATFFPTHLPHIKNFKHKARGVNGRGNPVDFSEDEKRQVQEKLRELMNKKELFL